MICSLGQPPFEQPSKTLDSLLRLQQPSHRPHLLLRTTFMLLELHIQNFVLIDQLHLDLPVGLSVITGETGAGKSLTLAAIGLLLGERSQAHLVAAGATQAEISANVDTRQLPAASAWLTEHDYVDEPDQLLIRRIIKPDGKSKAYLNNKPCSISALKELGEYLISFTSQHQQHQLSDAKSLLQKIDVFGGHQTLTQQTEQALALYQRLQQQLQQKREQLASNEQRRQLISYQLEELLPWANEAAQLAELNRKHQQLSHAEHNHSLLKQFLALFQYQPHNINQQLNNATRLLQQLKLEHPALKESQQFLQQIQIFCEESVGCAQTLEQLCDVDPQKLDTIDKTLTQLHKLAKKHQIEPQQLPAKQQALQDELDQSVQLADDISDLSAALKTHQQDLLTLNQQLHQQRSIASENLSAQLTAMVQELGMPHFRSQFVFGDADQPDAMHQVQWLIATHQQAQWQPLRQVASGGELSRITLAMSTICRAQENDENQLMIFDEIDTGVSGKIAENIGEHLAQLAKRQQILCVTHSAQVAARADQHFLAEKISSDTHSHSRLSVLNHEQRTQELARMIGGEQTQSQSLVYAKALLKSQQSKTEALKAGANKTPQAAH
jgi:DNA repair protein RecN (Recombination protein N)